MPNILATRRALAAATIALSLAATAAFGRISSQLSLSTRTSTPVASVNFLVIASQASSSPCTKGDQRNSLSFAPSSGVYLGASCA